MFMQVGTGRKKVLGLIKGYKEDLKERYARWWCDQRC